TGHDPDTLVREKGAAAVRDLIEGAEPLAEFVFSSLKKEHGLTLSGKSRIIAALAELMEQATDADQRELMAAHFSEQLGVSPDRFLVEQKAFEHVEHVPVQQWPHGVEAEVGLEMPSDWAPPDFSPEREEDWDAYPSSASEERLSSSVSLYELPKKQRQLLDFLLLYPEFLSELLAGGLKQSLGQSPIMGLVDAMEQLALVGDFTPEQLLSVVVSGSERQYIADLLSKDGSGHLGDESEEQGRLLCDELLICLKNMQRQKEGVTLQKRILAAEQAGNYSLVSKLQREKMLVVQGKDS
ncbi:MAG: hypothetical protein D3925_03875, partial [Candidatus Electrothrix sp. AR5]|nr:hypothetical protein [Candidatus Electrothrix sp. AR5]